jgi:hypothetical protein
MASDVRWTILVQVEVPVAEVCAPDSKTALETAYRSYPGLRTFRIQSQASWLASQQDQASRENWSPRGTR